MGGMGSRLRRLLDERPIVVAPGAYDTLSALLIMQAGFPALYLGGAWVTCALLGQPDVGWMTLDELVAQTRRTVEATDLPTVVDADAGFSGIVNLRRAVREIEWAGAAGLHLEDKSEPKGSLTYGGSVTLFPVEEMVLRLRAALDARRDPDFVIIARTDARDVEGLEGAIDRARVYAEAGADMIFVNWPRSEDELRRVGESVRAPLFVQLTEGGQTPCLPADRLADLGYKMVVYPGGALRAAAFNVIAYVDTLKQQGTGLPFADRLIPQQARNAITGLARLQEWEGRFTIKR